MGCISLKTYITSRVKKQLKQPFENCSKALKILYWSYDMYTSFNWRFQNFWWNKDIFMDFKQVKGRKKFIGL